MTNTAVHDSNIFEELLEEKNASRAVWADSAYRYKGKLEKRGFREHLQRKGRRNKKLTDREKQGNHTRFQIRSRVEHAFGVQAHRAGMFLVRTIGIVRATAKRCLRNLASNLDRYSTLALA